MKTVFEHIRERLERPVAIVEAFAKAELAPKPKAKFTPATLFAEWVPEFEQLQRNRLAMGCLRYGLIGAPGKKEWDRVQGIRKRLQQYEDTGNLECLVDVSNLSMLEFKEGKRPGRHWGALDGDHSCELVDHETKRYNEPIKIRAGQENQGPGPEQV